MFHVKHFGPVGAGNLTSAHMSCGRETCGIVQKIGGVGGWSARRCAARVRIKALGRPTQHAFLFAPHFCTKKLQCFQARVFRAKLLNYALAPYWRLKLAKTANEAHKFPAQLALIRKEIPMAGYTKLSAGATLIGASSIDLPDGKKLVTEVVQVDRWRRDLCWN